MPHEIDTAECDYYRGEILRFSGLDCVLFSEKESCENWDVLIVDAVGYLSSLYRLGFAAYVGGGFSKGIHNVLEPTIGEIPVFFGPKHRKFKEAGSLVKIGGGFEVHSSAEITSLLQCWLDFPERYSVAGKAAKEYLTSSSGACKIILDTIANSE